MFDLLLIVIFGIVTWCVASEGPGGAGVIMISTILSGLLAMNFFEPFAMFLQLNISSSPFANSMWDVVALVGLFALFVFLFRMLAERLAPSLGDMEPMVYEFGRWTCAALTGYVTMAFLATALHTAPLPRDFWGYFPPEPQRRTGPLGKFAPDYQWLGFTQYVSEKVFKQGAAGRVFDGPNYSAGDSDDHKDKIWPSFPIRYATRRQEIERGIVTGGPTEFVPQPSGKTDGGLDF